MEDAVAVVPKFMSQTCCHVEGCTCVVSTTSTSPIHFFGVFDGHGGSEIANFCAQRMHEVIAEEWEKEELEGQEWQKKWNQVLINGFKKTDDEVGTVFETAEMEGTTVAVAVVSACQIILSNCGDSRAILCRKTQTIPLTVEHKPDRADELSRIVGQGGKVINWHGARVLGVLSMSRAIGDKLMSPFIIPVPETTFMPRTDEDECLILASDGLWDVLSNDEVGDVARCILRRPKHSSDLGCDISPAQLVADCLTQLAFERNSTDNISVIVVDLKSTKRRQPKQ